jgi:hypothetical protein
MDLPPGAHFKKIIPSFDFVIMAGLPWSAAMHTSITFPPALLN